MDLVTQEGLAGLTIHRLAKELNYTVGALYRYFDSKDDLIAILQADGMMALLETLREIRRECYHWAEQQQVPADTKELLQLLVVGDFYASFALSGSAHYRLMSLMLGHPEPVIGDEQAKHVLMVSQPIFDDLREHLNRAVEVGALGDGPEQDRTLVLWSSLFGLMQVQKVGRLTPDFLDCERVLAQLLRSLLLGWGATTEKVDHAFQCAQGFKKVYSFTRLTTLENYSELMKKDS